jgi:transcriptional regulator GlxA family with amidase domain
MHNPVLVNWIRSRAAGTATLASVCTGALLLASAGLLDGLPATTHWQALDLLRQTFPRVSVDATRQYVQAGLVFTSAGISAGIDLALKLVEREYGEALARATARHMEYPYPATDARRMDLAEMHA